MPLRHPPRVVLIGMMGSGKSTVGSLLAERLGWPYLDSDAEILRSTGNTVPEIWRQRGEAAFRAEEARVLAEAAASDAPAVISCGGGTVLDPDNRRRIREAGLVVWLRAEPTALGQRVGDGEGRPLLDARASRESAAASLVRLAEERTPLYAELAEVVIDSDQHPPGEIATQIAGLVAARGGVHA
ncbi:MAG: shikimate kinase [Acidimicrobiales bacterium]